MAKYEGYGFRQNERSPVQVVFVAGSSEVDSWARVPTRLKGQPRGFQRIDVPGHVEEIRQFFNEDPDKSNSSPTSILVGIEPGAQRNVELHHPDGTTLDPELLTKHPTPLSVTINFEPWNGSEYDDVDAEITAISDLVGPRLIKEVEEGEEAATDGGITDSLDSPEPDLDNNGEDPTEGEDDEDSTATEGQPDAQGSDIVNVRTMGPADIANALTSGTWRGWGADTKSELLQKLKDERKPGLIIDGQHRIRATSSLPRIPFIVSLLPYADWAELAFQFIVNNSSAKKVDENLLFAIVGQSLNPQELQGIEGRLNRSGIKVSLIKASMKIHLEDNPFFQMLKTNTPGEPGYLDATAMQKKVVELWYGSRGRTGTRATLKKFRAIVDEPQRSKEYRIIDLFGANCDAANARERAEEWQAGLWFEYFKAFWEAVRDRYVSDGLWPASQEAWPSPDMRANTPIQRQAANLMGATILGMLQLTVLQRWAEKREDRAIDEGQDFKQLKISPDEFKKQITTILEPLTADFFVSYIRSGADASKQVKQQFIRALYDVVRRTKTVPDVKEAYSAQFRR